MADGKPNQEVIVIAAPRAAVSSHVAMAEEAGLDVVGVAAEACAVVECWSHLMRREDDASRTILFVHIGKLNTQVVLTHGRNLVFARTLAVGGECFDAMIAEGMGIGLAQANQARLELGQGRGDAAMAAQVYRLLETKLDQTAGELIQCMRYYESVFRNRRAELVVFVGGQAFDKNVCQALAKRLNLPAKIGDPLLSIGCADGAGPDAAIDHRVAHPDWTIAIGLSLEAIWGR
jgi:type IV pilus assembly protein PilM